VFSAQASCAGLFLIFDKKHLVNDRNFVFERDVQKGSRHSLCYQSGMIGFPFQNDTQGDDGLKTAKFSRGLNEKRDFKRAGRPDENDIRPWFQGAQLAVGIVHEGLDKLLIELAGDNRIRGRGVACRAKSRRKGF